MGNRSRGGGNGIEIGGMLNTGAGNDTIKASTTDYTAIKNYRTINTGTGDDTITGIGVRLGNGSFGTGINNQARCRINTGAGNDIIKGSSIDNSGTINTGAGKDIVNALKGGFGGDGKTYLGANNDKLMGFGTGKFYGGTGTDKILFGEGTYTISESTIVRGAAPMIIKSFEKIGGANGGIFDFRNGTLTVDSDGIATFA